MVQIIAAAATEACSVDGATLITTIDGLVNVPVTTGTVTYAGTGGVPEKDVVILEVKDGTADLRRGRPPDEHPQLIRLSHERHARGRSDHHA